MANAVSPYREAIVQALTSYYKLLTEFPYLPESAIQTPPPGGWSGEHRALFNRLGKSEAVVDILCHIPYIVTDEIQINYDTFARDWRAGRVQWAVEHGQSLTESLLEPMLQTIPSNVICLTRASNYGRWLLLNVDTGDVTNYSLLGGPDPMCTDEEIEAGIGWKRHETKSVTDLFGDWSEKLRSLEWIPIPPEGDQGNVRLPMNLDDPDQEKFRAIYREYGWGTDHFRKEECRQAVVAEDTRQFKAMYNRVTSAKAARRDVGGEGSSNPSGSS